MATAKWRAANLERHRANVRRAQVKKRGMLDDIKRVPCMDCGVEYPPEVMEFDHVRGVKVGHISQLVSRVKWSLILEEVKKCDIVCANCHRLRTISRRNDGSNRMA